MITLLDCTIRDGGFFNQWNFEDWIVRDVYRAVSASGVGIAELGYRISDKFLNSERDAIRYGKWKSCREEDLREVTEGLKRGGGAKIAVMSDFGKIELTDFIDAKESVIDIVRLAAHKDQLFRAIQFLEKLKEKGYEVSLNAMGCADLTEIEQKELISALKQTSIDIIYLADSYGSIFPHQIRRLFEPFLEMEKIKVGFHAHNNLQMAFANALEAISCGVDLIDSTLYGMGRGAGNLGTEIIVLYLQLLNREKYDVIPILNCIDSYFLRLKNQLNWGYQLHFMLSGMYQCHPNFAKELVELREYAAEDICRIMERIKQEKPIGYQSDLVRKILALGYVETSKADTVPYIDRHQGRDFLILANGPSLKQYKSHIDRFIEKYNPVVMGTNHLSGLFIPDYHAFNNKKRFTRYVDSVNRASKLLLSQYFDSKMMRDYTARSYESLYYKDQLASEFSIKNGVIQTNCRTISVLLMGIAVVMGARRIFVAGMDGYLGPNIQTSLHYYRENDENLTPEMLRERHFSCQGFLSGIDDYLTAIGREKLCFLTPTSYQVSYRDIETY